MNLGMIFSLIGGLGLFIFGMQLMGEGLQKAAGNKLKNLLEVLTNNRVMGILLGVGITAIIQSSSATTVMVIGFVNAGLMTLTQAAGVIMGANIGTTVTAQLIAFKLTSIAPIAVGLGVGMYLFSKNKKVKQVGEIFLGFGILFTGMQAMESAMAPLAQMEGFKQLVVKLARNPLLGVLVGFGMTAIVQSSSATIGILMALASTGAIGIDVAMPVLFGDNIGTCVTALLASINANRTAKKAALIHLTFNVIGTLIFLILLHPVEQFIGLIAVWTNKVGDVQSQIANAHTFFNLANTLIQAPFIPLLVKFVNIVIPGDDSPEGFNLKYLDERIIQTPSIAVEQTLKEAVDMGNLASQNISIAMDAFLNQNEDSIKLVYENEEHINFLERGITSYLVKLSQESLTDEQSKIVTSLFHTVNDIERIGDHCENIAELASYRITNILSFSDEALSELKDMYGKVKEAVDLSLSSLGSMNRDKALDVMQREIKIDEIDDRLRDEHIDRLNKEVCSPSSGAIFLDLISNLERMGDYATNIAEVVLK